MKKITILLGAGFSANAGMPIANNIANYFNRDLRDKLLSFSSSEWAWTDNKDDIELNNGSLSFERLAYSYALNELAKKYSAENGIIDNYEVFYQYCIDLLVNQTLISEIFDKAKKELIIDHPHLDSKNENYDRYYDGYTMPFTTKQYSKFVDIINYLIADILSKYISDEELLETFKDFLKFLEGFDELDIFTLNHDLLLERLFDIKGIKYSRGFTKINTPIHGNGKALPFYTGNFNSEIRIFKLHGSLDLYKFNHYKLDGLIWRPTGDYDYYLTTDYYEKHNAQRLNPNTQEIVQETNFNIVPKFITGIRKTDIIQNDKMYKHLFEKFEDTILNTEILFVSGYSFNDEHINQIIQ